MTNRLKDPLSDRDKFLGGESEAAEAEQSVFTIGDLSREFGITLRTLRFYEDKGLLHPERNGLTRLYSRRDRARLKLVLLGKRAGFSLSEIREMIELYDLRDGQVTQLRVSRERFVTQIAKLKKQKADIDAAIAELTNACDQIDAMLDQKQTAVKASA